jgi:hypothetical protein
MDDPSIDADSIGGLQKWKIAEAAKVGPGKQYETEEAFWYERCGNNFIGNYRGIYQRLQGRRDHALGYNYPHAISFLNAATSGNAKWTRLNKQPKNIVYKSQERPDGVPIETALDIEELHGNELLGWRMLFSLIGEVQGAECSNGACGGTEQRGESGGKSCTGGCGKSKGENMGAVPFGFHPGSANNYEFITDLGAAWSREGSYVIWDWVDPNHNGEYKFTDAVPKPKSKTPAPENGNMHINYDAQWLGVPPGVRIVANVCPFRWRSEFKGPQELETYKNFVEKTVERYDGDDDYGCVVPPPDCYKKGDRQKPSAEAIGVFRENPVKHWQVCNQVNVVCEGKDCRETYAKKFAELQKATYEAVKKADSSAKVLIAGDSQKELYPKVFQELKGGYIDIVDHHRFGSHLDYEPGGDFDYIKEGLRNAGFDLDSLEFWMTETGTYSGDPLPDGGGRDYPYQSERQQAMGLLKIYVSALAYGIGKVFWAWNIVEGFGCDCCIFDYTGLVYDGNPGAKSGNCEASDPHDRGAGVKKLSYYTYKKIAEVLKGSDWCNIQPV